MDPPKPRKQNGRGRSSAPYTSLAIAAMQSGLTFDEARSMGLARLMWFVSAWAEMNSVPEDGGAREATQEDIDAILK